MNGDISAPTADQMWLKLRTQRFPQETSWQNVRDSLLLLTDSYAAGCITTYLSNEPRTLDAERIIYLKGCEEELDEALASSFLENDSRSYFSLLREIYARVLIECGIAPDRANCQSSELFWKIVCGLASAKRVMMCANPTTDLS